MRKLRFALWFVCTIATGLTMYFTLILLLLLTHS